MANIKDLKEGAEILQNVDVGNIFTSLALGIAEAQEKLDNNSVAQIIKLSEQKIGDKSLLELGFVPAFYAFTEANINASISLKMAMKESFSIEGKFSFDLNKNKGYSKDFLNSVQESQNSTERKEFKSSKDFTLSASEKNSIKIETQSIKINEQDEAINKIESFTDKMLAIDKVSRVDRKIEERALEVIESKNITVSNHEGFLSFYINDITIDKGILKIKNGAYNTNVANQHTITIQPPSKKFKIEGAFLATLTAAKTANGSGGKVYGITSNGFYADGSQQPEKFVVYFKHGKHKLDNAYNEVSPSDSKNYNNANVDDRLNKLASVLKSDPSLTVKIIGHTDNTGPENPSNTFSGNIKLGKDRAEELKNFLKGAGVNDAQIITESKSETEHNTSNPPGDVKDVKYRKAVIDLTGIPDYILFEGGDFKVDPTNSPLPETFDDSKNHGFIFKQKGKVVANGDYILKFKFSGETYDLTDKKSYTEIEQYFAEKSFSKQRQNERLYLLHNETKIHYTLYSKDSSDISISEEKNSSSSSNGSESSVIISDTVNSKSITTNEVNKANGGDTMAIGASLDVRYARQFEMSVEGNASMSAKMVALPPPEGFTQYIINSLGE